uniref:Thioredoxin domain containing 16 n=1 Tax=Tetraodon nigroviridis TaxID=99883 RepID=H3BX08_TETNG
FFASLHAGKTMFIFFEHFGSPTKSVFLKELEKSSDVLKDYGVLVGKVNCNKEVVTTYCTEERALHAAFLFRGGHEFLTFSLDTVFDVNAIVSEVLFAILREEVKYVHTGSDLMILEKTARGKKDIVVGYPLSLGTAEEHRSLMETAYAYGSKHQFVLVTGGPVLKDLGAESSHASQVWFLHCRVHTRSMSSLASGRCRSTTMSKPLTTLHLHSFLQLMEAPLVAEVSEDPSTVLPPPVPYRHTPQVFVFSHPATAHLDMDTATALAWELRGRALVMLVHRESPEVKTSYQYNVACRFPEKSSEVKYMTLQNLNEVLKIFTHNGSSLMKNEMITQIKERRCEKQPVCVCASASATDQLDDEIASSVYRSHGLIQEVDSVTELTPENFHHAVAQRSLTVVLFYFQWDAVSSFFYRSYVEVAERFAGSEVQMSSVNCEEWTLLCAAQSENSEPIPFQPITYFPCILLLRPEEPAQVYSDMLDTEALYRFIVLSQKASPLKVSTQEEISSFLQEVPPQIPAYHPERVFGLFKSQTDAGVSVFTEAARSLRGKVLTGLGADELAEKWAAEHSVHLPAVFVFPSWRTHTPTVLPMPRLTEELLSQVNTALLHPMPELTVENLPSFLALGKALLLLFVGEEADDVGRRQNQKLVEEMKAVVALGDGKMEKYLPSWIHLGRTPAAMSVLGSYFGSTPSLPALVLTHLPSGQEIYQYPPNMPIVAPAILAWLQRIEDGSEPPAGNRSRVDSWIPAFEFLDFLKLMD